MRKKCAVVALILLTLACQVIPTPPPLRATPRPSPSVTPVRTAVASFTPPARGTVTPLPTGRSPGDLAPFPYQARQPFAAVQPKTWAPVPVAASADLFLPVAAKEPANLGVIAGLSLRQQERLMRDGFVIVHTQEEQFDQVRRRVAVCYGQPYYLTTDAAYHAIDGVIDALIPLLEQEELHRRAIAVARAAMNEVLSYLPSVQGSPLEAEVLLAAAYLGVGLRLLEPEAALDERIGAQAVAQVEQVRAAHGIEDSLLIPGYRDDFRLYRPAGRYLGASNLGDYARGMTWFRRAVFLLDAPNGGRASLILTLALRRARLEPGNPAAASGAGESAAGDSAAGDSAAEEWSRLHETLTFLYGPGLGYAPPEYAALMDMIYSPGVTVVGLADGALWERFRLFARELPREQLGALPRNPLLPAETVDGWRWMPYGFDQVDFLLDTLSEVRPRVADQSGLPSGLEIMGVFGSAAAIDALKAAQPVDPSAYLERVSFWREQMARQTPASWGRSAGSIRLAALRSQLVDKGVAFPSPQRTAAWQYKDLNSALGAWIDQRRDLPAGQIANRSPSSNGDRPLSSAAPAYVEPNPEVFYRLALLATTLGAGLQQRGLTGVFSTSPTPGSLPAMVQETLDLGDRLERLGEIATHELAGEPTTESDWELIGAPLFPANDGPAGAADCLAGARGQAPPSRLIELRGPDGRVQYAATGLVDRLYALVPLGDELMVAQGALYSVYQFPQTEYGEIDEADWRRLLENHLEQSPSWSAALYEPTGDPVDVLAFRPGYAYRVTSSGGRINVRAAPSRTAAVTTTLSPGSLLTLLEGPVTADGFIWWKVRTSDLSGAQIEGWLVENQLWFQRAG